MELNIYNIPINTLYRFDINKYVWTTYLTETRGNSHKQDRPLKVTEVYEITDEGYMRLVASGKLINEPDKGDFSREFGIFDYDKETTTNFKVTMYLHEVGLKELYELRNAVARTYRKNNK